MDSKRLNDNYDDKFDQKHAKLRVILFLYVQILF